MALETVTPEPDPSSLAAHILAETPPVETPEPEPAPVETPLAEPDPAVTAAAEADSAAPDASVSAAARALRANRADARKARIQAEIDAKIREREAVRAEVERLKQALPAKPDIAVQADAGDPKPKLEDFEDFSAFMDARDAWTFREADRRHEAKAREVAQAQAAQTVTAKLVERGAEARAAHADYDEVIEPVIARFDGYPGAHVVADFIASSPVGGAVFYRLGKDAAALDAVLTADSPTALTRALARLEAQVSAPVSPAPIATRAPAPPKQTVGGGAQSTTVDTRAGVPLADHIRIEEAEIADRRRRGLRY